MIIICREEHRSMIEKELKDFLYIDTIIIEKGVESEKIGIYFDLEHLNELKDFLQRSEASIENTIVGMENGKYYIIHYADIIYIEGLDRDAYICTDKGSYKTNIRLYQLEERLPNRQFIRISKSFIVNMMKIESVSPSFNSRLTVYMNNNIKLEINRSFVLAFKKRIGIR